MPDVDDLFALVGEFVYARFGVASAGGRQRVGINGDGALVDLKAGATGPPNGGGGGGPGFVTPVRDKLSLLSGSGRGHTGWSGGSSSSRGDHSALAGVCEAELGYALRDGSFDLAGAERALTSRSARLSRISESSASAARDSFLHGGQTVPPRTST